MVFFQQVIHHMLRSSKNFGMHLRGSHLRDLHYTFHNIFSKTSSSYQSLLCWKYCFQLLFFLCRMYYSCHNLPVDVMFCGIYFPSYLSFFVVYWTFTDTSLCCVLLTFL